MTYSNLEHSKVSFRSHLEEDCTGEVCAFHKRTDHHMRKYKQFFRFGTGMMERVCSHGVGHPDPDDAKIVDGTHDGTHECDACCIRFATEEEYQNKMKEIKENALQELQEEDQEG
jgi:hypothetical protein